MSSKAIFINGDGGSRGNPGPGASAFVISQNGKEIHSESKYLGETTNNIAEYNCVIMALNWVKENSNHLDGDIVFRLDSELVTKQLLGDYKVKSKRLIPLHAEVNNLRGQISNKIIFTSVPRSQNQAADKLVNEELDKNAK